MCFEFIQELKDVGTSVHEIMLLMTFRKFPESVSSDMYVLICQIDLIRFVYIELLGQR